MIEKLRNEVDEKDKWDLSSIYENEDELRKDYQFIENKIVVFSNFENTFLQSANDLYICLNEVNNIDYILEKMIVYANHSYDTDITNNNSKIWKEKIYNLIEKFYLNSSFLIPKLLSFGFDKVEKFYIDLPKLKEEYDFYLKEVFRDEKHILSEKEEKLISSLNKTMTDTSEISCMLSDSDIDFGYIEDENGEKVKLTDTNYIKYISSQNREVRKNAFNTLYKSYRQFNNTFALLLASEIEKNKAISKVRNFDSSLEASLFGDNVNKNVYDNLIKTVNNNLKPLHEYYELKRQLLNLEQLHLYDTYTPLVKDVNTKYTFDEAKELVLSSLNILGKDYSIILNKAFDNRWIDIYPNKGKRGGAYSGGAYKTNPYVLLNFNGNYNDVSTLAHELGHSVHTYYSNENNPYHYSKYKIFVAEVASQVNELLLNDYMLKKAKTKEEKIYILNQLLETFKSSIYRQTMFAEFEKEINKISGQGEVLTAKVFNEIYYDLVKTYFGDNVVIDEEIKYEWSRIPHFYYNFYVYKYSTGLAAAAHIVKNILTGDEKALKNYLEFLKVGGSMHPLDTLKVAGVDLEDSETVQSALDMFKSYLDDFNKLINS